VPESGNSKTRDKAEAKRAHLARTACEAERGPAREEFVRSIEKGKAEQRPTVAGRVRQYLLQR
jgi:hypothetical protein